MFNEKQIKVALYIRSNKMSNDEIKRQEDMLLKFCEINDYLIYDLYIDSNCSALKSNRTEYKRMLEDMKKNKFDLIVSTNLERITRSMKELVRFRDMVTKYNCDFRTLNGNDLYCLKHLMLSM